MATISSNPTLTSAQRVARALERRDHDRVPRFDQFWPETIQRWQAEGLAGDPAEIFDFDIQFVGYLAPAPFPGQNRVIHEDDQTQIIVNSYGESVRYFKNRTGTPEHIAVQCSTPEIWRKTFKPRMNVANCPPPLESMRSSFEQGRLKQRYICLCGRHALMTAQSLLGTQGLFTEMAADPEWIIDIAQTYTDHLLATYDAILAQGIRPDALWCFDDLAYTQAPFMSVPMYRQLFWPSHRRTIAWAHERGIKFILHTDGDVRSFLDSFLEAGVDCLQPLECKAHMDIRDLAPRYGGRLSFFGNIDMIAAITNNPEKIEAEVLGKLAAGMKNRGYLYHSDHSVPPQVSWDSYKLIHQLLDRFGRYE